MEFISANPDLFDIIHTWAKANPMEFMGGLIGSWAAFCFFNATKHSFK